MLSQQEIYLKNLTPNFKTTQTVVDSKENIVYRANRQLAKKRIKMADRQLLDSSLQLFYFLAGYQLEGQFKEMARTLKEQSYKNI